MVNVFCAKCGKEFKARDMRVRFCPDCQEARNKKEQKYCLVCGKPIELGKYCSNECRKKIQAQKIKEHNANTHGLRIDKELYNKFVFVFIASASFLDFSLNALLKWQIRIQKIFY